MSLSQDEPRGPPPTSKVSLEAGPVAGPMHLLPCNIEGTGPAPVSKYFKVKATDKVVDGAAVVESAFRGRALKGIEQKLPEGYTGYTLELGVVGDAGVGQPAEWNATGTFDSFTMWRHDTAPTSSETLTRAINWLDFAKVVHGVVSEDEVTRMVEERGIKSTLAGGMEVGSKRKAGAAC